MDDATLFEGFDPAKYEAEAEQRWGHRGLQGIEAAHADVHAGRLGTHESRAGAIYAGAFKLLQAGESPSDPAGDGHGRATPSEHRSGARRCTPGPMTRGRKRRRICHPDSQASLA